MKYILLIVALRSTVDRYAVEYLLFKQMLIVLIKQDSIPQC